MRALVGMVGVALLLSIACGGWADVITVNGDDAEWARPVLSNVITVDGDDSEWTSPDFSNDDTNGDVVDPGPPLTYLWGYDIDYTYYLWDEVNGMSGFLAATVDPTDHSYSADFIEILIDADSDTSTGGTWHNQEGADYRIYWDYDGTANTAYTPGSSQHPVYLQQWTGTPGSEWSTIAGLGANDLLVAWGNEGSDYSVIEVALNPTYIGNPDQFVWGFYLDNGTTASDDASPNNMRQRGYTPEPATLTLLSLGLAGVVVWRRRKPS